MRYLLDTNILLDFLTNRKFYFDYKDLLDFSLNNLFVSSVSKGELLSLAKQRGWGEDKEKSIKLIFEKLINIDISLNNDSLHEAYAQIDAYSRGKATDNNNRKIKGSSKTMGKNDLWIAASTVVSNTILVTADKDFEHLNGVFFPVLYIEVPKYKPFTRTK